MAAYRGGRRARGRRRRRSPRRCAPRPTRSSPRRPTTTGGSSTSGSRPSMPCRGRTTRRSRLLIHGAIRDAGRRPVRHGAGDRDRRPPRRARGPGRRRRDAARASRAPGSRCWELAAGRRPPRPRRRRAPRGARSPRGEVDASSSPADRGRRQRRHRRERRHVPARRRSPRATASRSSSAPRVSRRSTPATTDGAARSSIGTSRPDARRLVRRLGDVTPARRAATGGSRPGPRRHPRRRSMHRCDRDRARPRPSPPAVRRDGVALMASVAIPGRRARGALTVQTTTGPRDLLRDFLEQRPAVRRVRDLRPRGPRVRPDPLGRRRSTATRSSRSCSSTRGLTPQPLFVMGRDDGIEAILRDVVRPRAAYLAALTESLPAVETPVPGRPGPADGPDVGRPGALPAVPGGRPAARCRSRSAS